MQNFIKTILNAVQLWTKKQIKNSKADWNQSDPNADDYVKNRTHWTEETPVIIVENLSSQDYPSEVYPRHSFTIGFEYDVTWNGILYERLICQSVNGYRALGNSDRDNLPFYIDDDETGYLYVRALDGSEDWTLSIVEYAVKVYRLDSKYLPEDAATKLDVAYAVEWAEEAGEKADIAIEEALNAQIVAEGKVSMPASGELNQILAVTESVNGVPTKIECVDGSKDWEQHDETKADYIRNRTHYYDVATYASVENQSGSFDLAPVGYLKDRKRYLHENSIFRIIINGVENIISTKPWIGDEGQATTGMAIFGLNADGWTLNVGITLKLHRQSGTFMASISFDNQDKEITCSAYYEQRDVKLLDEKYLPNTIARVADIPSIEGLATEEYVNEALAGFEGNGVSYVAQDTAPEDTDVLWVDTADNTEVEIGANDLVVTIGYTNSTYFLVDITYEDIVAAIDEGRVVWAECQFDDNYKNIYHLSQNHSFSVDNPYLRFSSNRQIYMDDIMIHPNKVVRYYLTTVPNTRKINNKPLSTDIALTATDVGAIATVNGVAPDAEGNVEIESGSGCNVTVDEETMMVSSVGSGSGSNKKYELIDTITVEDDMTELIITKTPEGENYNFDSVIVMYEIPAGSYGDAAYYAQIFSGDKFIALYQQGTPNATYQKRADFKFENINGRINAESTAFTLIYYSGDFGYTDGSAKKGSGDFYYAQPIYKLRLRSNKTMPIGMVIKIWGVRA